MSPIERWFLRRIFAKQVRQGYDHPQRITELYRLISDAMRREFSEDNEPTHREYNREWFEAQYATKALDAATAGPTGTDLGPGRTPKTVKGIDHG